MMSLAEVAVALHTTKSNVQGIERRALLKLARNPSLRRAYDELKRLGLLNDSARTPALLLTLREKHWRHDVLNSSS